MPKVKIPRKSTNIDMTAMCDVAFLLLTFFILATKQKPPEVLAVTPPSSISAKAVPDKSIMITLTKDGKAFLMLGDDTKKGEILENVNLTKGLNLTPSELTKWKKQEFYGLPFNMVKSALALSQQVPATKMPGIPIDSSNNEMTDWVRSISNVYAGTDQRTLQEMLMVKGDNETLYPQFKAIKQSFKKNDIFKFRIVTNGETVPIGSELYNESVSGAGEK
ncbi:MAG TPA: biopolymer transporter ExbD [Ferruginibacter sp.]|jgi:biopolymer transport protein ExbD|nr:biopolymer transporter ExbD [Bacteroidota bacterium]MCC6692867.1 biopolymer transporter ExbD [Chitinophagaceae bacterium]HMT95411.1 biopolymer transporter ExbD [Ferruginibacter sp.]HMU23778.1 biopolymer transporter ExbD [Ferruginibacter sp.]